jgi:ABC-type siderophore export system fused ATPase/permease subunit
MVERTLLLGRPYSIRLVAGLVKISKASAIAAASIFHFIQQTPLETQQTCYIPVVLVEKLVLLK